MSDVYTSLGGSEMSTKDERKTKSKQRRHKLGFTNKLAICILIFLAAGLLGGFVLAYRSIEFGYTGELICWTVTFTPIGTACSIVLNSIVKKSEKENLGANGEGVKYAAAKACNFNEECDDYEDYGESEDSPII